jgi:hypothetical protein
MNPSQLKGGRTLRADDLGTEEWIVTIRGLTRRNLAKPDDDPDIKWIVYFKELDRPMAAGPDAITRFTELFPGLTVEEWIGQKCAIYRDPNVTYGGKRVGGLRPKEITAKSIPPPAPVTSIGEVPADDDVPWGREPGDE